MKNLFLPAIFVLGFTIIGKAQNATPDRTTLLFENDKVRVTEFISSAGNDVCGPGLHTHDAHVSILLSDATVKVTPEEGASQVVELKSGTTFWSDPETHIATNNGDSVVRVILVDLKAE